MSRYGMDKALRRLMQDEAARAAWKADPAAVLGDCDLEPAERQALVGWEVGTLYAMGAHPFLLWNAFTMMVDDREQVRTRYLDAISPHGYPDVAT